MSILKESELVNVEKGEKSRPQGEGSTKNEVYEGLQ